MYNLLAPLPPGSAANWNEDSIQELWCDILRRKLPDGDRVEHDVEDTRWDLPRPYCATRTLELLSPKRKRKVAETSVAGRSGKRQRLDSSERDSSESDGYDSP